jgi:6-phosphofructo-2-kinase/fructose-2,6-biphosphatase 4
VADLRSGVWDGLSTQEAMELYPDEWERFLADPYAHRAPRAESYHDLGGEYFAVIEKCFSESIS